MNVLITRPDNRGQQLVELLAQRQIFALHQPLFQVEAGRDLPLLPSVFSALKAGDYLFAVSKNAIEFAHQTLLETGFKWRSDLHYFCVGQHSAMSLASASEQAVRYPLEFANSEGLLDLPEMQNLTGKTVVILRAESGREFFAEQATQRGAEVKRIECYQRRLLVEPLGDKISLAKRAGIDTVVITSSEALRILTENTLATEREWLLDCQLVVVSQRIGDEALRLGWRANQVFISPKADNISLLETLLQVQKG